MKKLLGSGRLAFVLAMVIILGGAGIYFFNNTSGTRDESSLSAPREPAASASAQQQQQLIDKMTAKVLAIKSRGEVRRVAEEIAAMGAAAEAKNSPGVQMYAAVASLVPQLEGVIYRCRAFVETSDWLHMATLFGFRDFKYNNYLYGTHIEAIFDYLSYPSKAAGAPFASVSELQDFLLFQIAPKLENALKLMSELEKLPSENFEFQFDRSILVGQNNGLRFIDPSEAKKLFIKPNFYTVEFLLQRSLGTIYYAGAMDLNELPIVYNRVIKKTTMNNFIGNLRLSDTAKGVTPQMTYTTIGETRSFLEWRTNIVSPSGEKLRAQEMLDRAFYYGDVSARNQLAAYVCGLKYPYFRSRGQVMQINDKAKDCMVLDKIDSVSSFFVPSGSRFIFNPNSMILNSKQKYTAFRDRVRAYYEASQGRFATITSDVTGRPIQVNVKAFFNEQISQRDFLPTGYANVPPSSAAQNLAGVHAWNYEHGKPTAFKDYTFGGFFNKSQVNDINSLYQTMTTLLYTESVAPFAIFIRVPSTARYFIPPSEIVNQ